MTALLRSGTDFSNSGINRCAAADRTRIEHHMKNADQVHANGDGTAMLISTDYPAFEGEVHNGPFLRIALATGPSSRLVQHIDGAALEGVWRRGTLAISPPNAQGFAKAGKTSMIGLALLPDPGEAESPLDLDHITALAGTFQDDGLLVSVITTLRHEAAIHGASTAFFDEGRSLILRRLAELRGARPGRRKSHPLSDLRYAQVLAYVEDRFAYDLSVAQLARVAGMDSSGFTRALRARTGLAPYAWLTERRMERAEALLRSGCSVTQVATMCGYSNPGKFSSAFKGVTGLLPSLWIRAQEDRGTGAR
ncbi:helix-turn-helix domain-containing protein [Altererythrobacter indicus]|uniref:Helix-turn-helix domain-containing protein n=1 Tax=Altericroceibacterium indicum TaxID=374177 RepID=A0A845A966_9SPHN|nr:AraC family transcriptional regulator [Altericroceibacterium indicum]MXP26922.1 helix-turn-helix domain-containing protein [Altericroceibacterium indicum]